MKRTIFILCVIFVLMFSICINSCDTFNVKANVQRSDTIVQLNQDSIDLIDSIIRENLYKDAKSFLGTPYKWGATGPSSFDCSGFVKYIFNMNNINLPRTSYYQYKHTQKNLITKAECKRGDLVFFKGSGRTKNRPVGHVGMIISNDNRGIKFIHASSSRGVRISNLNESYYRQKFIGITSIV